MILNFPRFYFTVVYTRHRTLTHCFLYWNLEERRRACWALRRRRLQSSATFWQVSARALRWLQPIRSQYSDVWQSGSESPTWRNSSFQISWILMKNSNFEFFWVYQNEFSTFLRFSDFLFFWKSIGFCVQEVALKGEIAEIMLVSGRQFSSCPLSFGGAGVCLDSPPFTTQ